MKIIVQCIASAVLHKNVLFKLHFISFSDTLHVSQGNTVFVTSTRRVKVTVHRLLRHTTGAFSLHVKEAVACRAALRKGRSEPRSHTGKPHVPLSLQFQCVTMRGLKFLT